MTLCMKCNKSHCAQDLIPWEIDKNIYSDNRMKYICKNCHDLFSGFVGENEMEKTDREMADTYVSMIYSIRNKLQDIMDRFDDEHEIQAYYKLGGLREYLDSLIGDFEDGPPDEIPY